MDVYTTEEEQVAAIKRWLNTNGLSVVLGLMLGLGAIFGWRYWQAYQIEQQETASAAYEVWLSNYATKQTSPEFDQQFVLAGESFIDEHAQTTYADLARFYLATYAVTHKHYDVAAEHLTNLMNTSANESFALVARLRLAQVHLAENKANEALTLLTAIQPKAHQVRYYELLGDSYYALQQREDAHQAYQKALTHKSDEPSAPNPYLAMKLDDLTTAASSTTTTNKVAKQ